MGVFGKRLLLWKRAF